MAIKQNVMRMKAHYNIWHQTTVSAISSLYKMLVCRVQTRVVCFFDAARNS